MPEGALVHPGDKTSPSGHGDSASPATKTCTPSRQDMPTRAWGLASPATKTCTPSRQDMPTRAWGLASPATKTCTPSRQDMPTRAWGPPAPATKTCTPSRQDSPIRAWGPPAPATKTCTPSRQDSPIRAWGPPQDPHPRPPYAFPASLAPRAQMRASFMPVARPRAPPPGPLPDSQGTPTRRPPSCRPARKGERDRFRMRNGSRSPRLARRGGGPGGWSSKGLARRDQCSGIGGGREASAAERRSKRRLSPAGQSCR